MFADDKSEPKQQRAVISSKVEMTHQPSTLINLSTISVSDFIFHSFIEQNSSFLTKRNFEKERTYLYALHFLPYCKPLFFTVQNVINCLWIIRHNAICAVICQSLCFFRIVDCPILTGDILFVSIVNYIGCAEIPNK